MGKDGIAAGTVLGQRYRAEALVGRGGMGEVWRCRDLEQQRDVAVKLVRSELARSPWVARYLDAKLPQWRGCTTPASCRCSTSGATPAPPTW